MKLSGILKIAGIGLGIVMAVILVNVVPVKLGLLGLGALIYFIGAWLKKKGK